MIKITGTIKKEHIHLASQESYPCTIAPELQATIQQYGTKMPLEMEGVILSSQGKLSIFVTKAIPVSAPAKPKGLALKEASQVHLIVNPNAATDTRVRLGDKDVFAIPVQMPLHSLQNGMLIKGKETLTMVMLTNFDKKWKLTRTVTVEVTGSLKLQPPPSVISVQGDMYIRVEEVSGLSKDEYLAYREKVK